MKTRGLWQYLKRISLYYELPILRNIALISYCSERDYCEFTGCAFPKDLSFPNSYETIQHITKSPYDKVSANTASSGSQPSEFQCGHRVVKKAPLHQGQLRSVVGNSPIMGGDPTIGGNPTTGWYSTQHLVGILTIFTIDAI